MQVTCIDSGHGKANLQFNGCNQSSTSSTETESTEHYSKSNRYIFNTVDSQLNQHLNDPKKRKRHQQSTYQKYKRSKLWSTKKVVIDDKISIEHLLSHLYMMKPLTS